MRLKRKEKTFFSSFTEKLISYFTPSPPQDYDISRVGGCALYKATLTLLGSGGNNACHYCAVHNIKDYTTRPNQDNEMKTVMGWSMKNDDDMGL